MQVALVGLMLDIDVAKEQTLGDFHWCYLKKSPVSGGRQ